MGSDTHCNRNPAVICKHQFRSDHFDYDPQTDEFICPNKQRLTYLYSGKHKTDNGYESKRQYYECQNCQDCLFRNQCTQAKGDRRIQVSLIRLLEYRCQVRENLTSETGKILRKMRSVDVETVFGHIKHNMRLRGFHLRGLEKVNTEWGWSALLITCENWRANPASFLSFALLPLSGCF